MYGCESWTVKKAERQRIDAFELWCWGRLLRVPWTARISNQSLLKEINPEYSLEGMMLKLQYFWPSDTKSELIGSDISGCFFCQLTWLTWALVPVLWSLGRIEAWFSYFPLFKSDKIKFLFDGKMRKIIYKISLCSFGPPPSPLLCIVLLY